MELQLLAPTPISPLALAQAHVFGELCLISLLHPLRDREARDRQACQAQTANNRRRITADTAVRLSLYFGNSAEYWLNLQANYDLKRARRNLSPEDAAQIKGQRAA